MTEPGRLFDAEPTLSVGELNRAISDALGESFKDSVWVRGEIQQYHVSRNDHTYFELVEKDERRDRVSAVLRVALFRNDRPAVNRSLREVGVRLGDGIEVRVRGRVDYYPPTGRLQLVMNAVDPAFTVGRLAADRERVLRVLASEGLLDANAGLALPAVPLRVGLVASGGSASYRDFVHELGASGHDFRVAHCDVRVQGGSASRRVAWALRRLSELDLDVVVVVRGGGARSDLAAFDTEIVARAIAAQTVPVLTGIGHEIDRTVADEVAHTACKTPTAAAALLAETVDDFVDRLAHLAHRISARARSACSLADRQLGVVSHRVRKGAPAALGRERRALDARRRRASEIGRRGTRDARQRLMGCRQALDASARRGLRTGAGVLDAAAARLRALDPRRVLERGYTITRDEHGRTLRSARAVGPGTLLVTETSDGEVRSRVERGGARQS